MPPRQLLVLGNQLSFLPESFSNLKGLQLLGLKSHPGSPQKMVAKKGVIFLSRSKRWSNNDSHNGIFYQWKRGGLIFETSTLKLFFFPACRRSSRIWRFFPPCIFFHPYFWVEGYFPLMGGPSWPAYGFFVEGPVPYPEQLHFSTPLDRQLGELADPRLDMKFFLGILRGKTRRANKKGFHHPLFFLKRDENRRSAKNPAGRQNLLFFLEDLGFYQLCREVT